MGSKDIDEMQGRTLTDTDCILVARNVAYQNRKQPGNAALMIAETATQQRCALIVLGRGGFGSVQAFLLGSVSSRITPMARCPVLVVH